MRLRSISGSEYENLIVSYIYKNKQKNAKE